MAVKLTYTEAELATYMSVRLGSSFAGVLGLVLADGDYAELVGLAVLEYGTETIADISTIETVQLLLACARYHAWLYATEHTNVFPNLGGQNSVAVAQLNDHARKSLAEARVDVSRYRVALQGVTDGSVRSWGVTRLDDPYQEQDTDSEYSE